MSSPSKHMWIVAGGILLVVVVTGLWVLLPPLHSSFEAGMSKEEVLERFGEPLGRSEYIKEDTLYIGPEMEFLWENTIPAGTEVEMWTYRSLPGPTAVYFINGSDRVEHVAVLNTDKTPHPLAPVPRDEQR